ncbi:subtilisin-like serine protease [Bernardetia litoralis DSM 6794]|uniref:Subtilisin-like serine protease n=1 Tax=Bernardetia litoralis (strain ATCC 23117 / DSM 6794 / NBRC 15988 / NCIMB 1366 / Fx l1 / Sio-4) TaxID=880071 RepID=I4AH97_BERLS|nr:S8/S53 family peptidase [Bernardetia litoralis]AFM03332.1 subtilisin-like serine protease [Bernardetia litoralis DSM 6794]
MFSPNLFTNKAEAQTQFSKKSNYKLPKGITTDDIEAGRVWFTLKPEYKTAFESSNVLSRLITQRSSAPVNQLFPQTEARKQFKKTKKNKNISGVDMSLIYKVNLQENVSVFQMIDELMATGMVAIAEPVPANKMYYTPNDTEIARQNYLTTIKAFEAWEITKGDSTVLVGIVDSGFDFNHPDLIDKVYYNQNDPIDGIDNDEDGYIDNHYGWDFAGATVPDNSELIPDNNPQLPTAGVDHGISVSGCAAASTDNDLGIAGTGFNVKLVNTKHTPDDTPGSVSIYDGYSGVVYMAETGVKIINCSWGGAFPSQIGGEIIKSVVEDFGCLVIVAAGNDGQNVGQFPASYDGVISVASSTANDGASSFTNYDYSVDIMAPGSNIYTTVHSDASNGAYESTSGTSFSSPIVAGAAALTWAHRPELTPIQIGELLRITSDPIESALASKYQGKVGHGRLNMERALTEFPVAVRMTKFEFVNAEIGGIPYSGDEAFFNAEFVSYLAPSESDFQIKVEAVDNTLSVIDTDVIFEGVINTNETITTENQIRLQVDPSLENFGVITLRITYTQDGYEAQEFASVSVNPTFITIEKNNIKTSMDSRGTIGRHDESTIGDGFVYNDVQTLYELGFMMSSGTNKLANAARSTNENYDDDFRIIAPIAIIPSEEDEPTKLLWQTKFNDDGAVSTKLSVNTTQTIQVWTDEGAEDFVVVEYVFENTNNQDITDFYAGLYGDWDIGEESSNNQVVWKEEYHAAIISSKVQGMPRVGVSVLELFADKTTYSLISNDETYTGTPYGVYDGFTDNEKKAALKGHPDVTTLGTGIGTDVSATVSAGPYTIPAGEKIVIAFALAAGNSVADIETSVAKANELYTPSIEIESDDDDNDDDDDDDVTGIEYENELAKAIRIFPNPTSNEVNIDISALNSTQPIEFTVLNILGQQVIKTTLTQGQTTLKVDTLPAGQYILRFNNGTTIGTKTLIIK